MSELTALNTLPLDVFKQSLINSSKTQLIWFGTTQQIQKLDVPLLSRRFSHFIFLSSVRDLDVTLDSSLSFSNHISNLTRTSYFHLRCLRDISKSDSTYVFTSIIHAFFCSRIDYCDSLLIGLPKVRLSPLQTVLNASAQLIAHIPRISHISSFMTLYDYST